MVNETLFRDESVGKAILKTSLPAVFIIIIMLIYNMADMFFIGQLGDYSQISAISLAGPLMSVLSGFGTLLGSGGCAAIALFLGRQELANVKKISAFCIVTSITIGVIVGVAALIFMPQLLDYTGAVKASEATARYMGEYLRVLAFGAPFAVFSSCMADAVRGEGAITKSMVATIVGSLLNIALNALFILVFGWGVTGAALSTVIGQVTTSILLAIHIAGKKSILSLNPKHFSLSSKISLKVLSLGLPSAVSVLVLSVSSVIRNYLAVDYGDIVVAAMGVTGRVTMLVVMLQMGVTMGIQPLIGYNFGAKNIARMSAVVKRVAIATVVMGAVLTAAVIFWRNGLIAIFINNADVITLGSKIAVISLVTAPIFGLGNLSSVFLQSTEKPLQATIVAVLRQGVILLPLSYIGSYLFKLDGLLWSSPMTDLLAIIIAVSLSVKHYLSILKKANEEGQ